MHRLAHFKLKKKPLLHETNRSSDKESATSPSETSVPVLELSLPDSKSFRASVILPDLSRRFTLLRRNGELLPLDNFCEQVRHELETGHITAEDENILIRQYQQQYLSETPSYILSSPSDTDTPPLSPPAPKIPPWAVNQLFSGNSAARDATYIQKALRMCDNQKKSEASQLDCHTGEGPAELLDSASTSDDISKISSSLPPTPLDTQTTPQSDEVIQTSPTKSSSLEDWEDKSCVELTQTQLQRLSLAVDRILGSQLVDNFQVPDRKSDSVSQRDGSDHLSGPHCSTSVPLDAETRVHEELLRALPDETSPTALRSSSAFLVNPQPNNGDTISYSSSLSKDETHRPQKLELEDAITLASTSSDGCLTDEDLELLPENDFENASSVFEFGPSDFEDVPPPAPIFNRNQPLPSLGWTYDDVLFIQQTLCSLPTPQQQTSVLGELTYADVLFIQGALCTSQSHQSQQATQPKTVDKMERTSSQSTYPSSVVGSPETSLSMMSPRSSSLHHRLNLAKNFAMDPSQKMAPFHHPSSLLQLPEESSSDGSPSFLQMPLPCSTESPDISSFPLTPPPVARPSLAGRQCDVHSSPTDSCTSPNEIHPARLRSFNSRAGRPAPTTILFRDVEAQVVAANAALRQVSGAQTDGPTHSKKPQSRKKSISTSQVGAPKLVSASAKLSELELERSGLDRITSHTDASKDMSKKSSFKLRLKKKRPSDSRFSNDDIPNVTSKHPDSSKPSQVDKSRPSMAPPSTAFLHARDSINTSPVQTSKHHSADSPEAHPSWKHSHALTDRMRKFMGRQRKITSNSSMTRPNPEPTSSIGSNDTSSEAALVRQVPNLHNPEDPQELGLESDTHNVWPRPPSVSKSECSKNINDLGFATSNTPMHDSDNDEKHDRNSLCVSVIKADTLDPAPMKSEHRHSRAEVRSFQKYRTSRVSDNYQGRFESDVPTMNLDSSKENPSQVDPVGVVMDPLKFQHAGLGNNQVDSSPWFESQGSEPHSPNSDCASSILDLYGCDSQSNTASDPKRSSSVSCYSNPYDHSRPVLASFPTNRMHNPTRQSNLLQVERESVHATSLSESQPVQSHMVPMQRNSAQNDLMVMVQQLQNSTRYSEFEPSRKSLNLKEHGSSGSSASSIQHIVPGHPDVNPFHKIIPHSHDHYVDDDDDEEEVWKQILTG